MSDTIRLADFVVPAQAYKAFNPLFATIPATEQLRVVEAVQNAMLSYAQEVGAQTMDDTTLKARSGSLRRSVLYGMKVSAAGSLNSIRVYWETPAYVAPHEYGAIIRPRTAKVLAIPLPAALMPDGTPIKRNPRDWKDHGTFSWHGRDGRGYLAYKAGRGPNARLVLLYVYVNEVKIPARLGLRQHYNGMIGDLYAKFGDIIADVVAMHDWDRP